MKFKQRLQKRVDGLDRTLSSVQVRIGRLQQIRLFLGLGIFLLLVASQILKGFFLEFFALFGLTPVFIFYFRKTKALTGFSERLRDLRNFYGRHLAFASGDIGDSRLPESMHNPDLARDLDLGVLFSGLNFCFSQQGEQKLNQWLCQDFGSSPLEDRQKYLKELSSYPGLSRRVQLGGSDDTVDFSRIQKAVERSFFEEPIVWKWVIPLAWFSLLLAVILGLPSLVWKGALFAYVGSMLFYMQRTQHLFSRLQDLHKDFSSLGLRLKTLEKLSQVLSFTPELKKNRASQDLRGIASLVALMSIKTNPILFYILNLILPWDFLLAELCEKARKRFNQSFQAWSSEAILLDVLGSFANLKTYHSTLWASQSSSAFIETQGLAHPLIAQDKVVTNDFHPKNKSIFIITGSNMSGKSTFLRALGLNFCLANIGAPVFAKSFSFQPMTLVSCIRVSDSLRDGQSYFYAEVQRMKSILEKAKTQKVLFLIDEPLKGTNNRERLIGNQSYLEQIMHCGAKGFISTHDLELTQLAEGQETIQNFHFGDQWVNDQLFFDYKIKEGPSQSTNALKILAQEGLFNKDDL